MKYLVVKDKRRRLAAKKLQIKKLCLKSLVVEHYGLKNFYGNVIKMKKANFLLYYKFYNFCTIYFNNNKGSLTLIKNRCIFTGRAKSINRYYKVSRIVFRELASFGIFSGVRKSSW